MDIKINKEIRDYSENMILGLNIRQAIFSAAAIVVSAGLFFLLRDKFNIEIISWICIIAAFPFVFMGFFKYHELPAEQILKKIAIYYLQPKNMTYTTTSICSELEKRIRENEIKYNKKHGKRKKRKKAVI